ncbi:peptidoglycan bridge formation glycyltransferase FemA/FemB family protein [Candidatus Berkelbacteria bacterium]|nr:peptidoglycan bridge formation glycyltransferase FemA/FemB family protein [Candidatus Berkelbacteria bacterium]
MDSSTSFLQTTAWEKFQQSQNHATLRVADQLMIRHSTFIGKYWYSPRAKVDDELVNLIRAKAVSYDLVFVRVDPELGSKIPKESYLKSIRPIQPQDTLVLDLTQLDLLASFHSKHRYNIRLAEKKGVTISKSDRPDSKELLAFVELAKKTSGRQQFRYHPVGYYRDLLRSDLDVVCYAAWYEGHHLGATIVLSHQGKSYYLHGASDYEHRKLMAPHLLQWVAIQDAVGRGDSSYDFYGIAPGVVVDGAYDYDLSHPWAGITRFKLGFNGQTVHYPNSFDIVLDPGRYALYKTARAVRKILPF